ncbi:MAG: DUF4437 domain-containing protein [Proteobacteria bacterium]|nr:DUF4437 domain-containing protein [Pseudomonadota bacterium]
MARPQIEFIQSQAIRWHKGLYGGARPDVHSKILSLDRISGASSVLIKYPAGWKRTAREHLLADEEFFVLDGSVRIAGIDYGPHCYANLPAGYPRLRASSRAGAIVLTFFSATPVARRGKAEAGLYQENLLVERLDSMEMPWGVMPDGSDLDPELGGRGALKTLRQDPRNGDWTFLYGAMPQYDPGGGAGKVETHTVVEEMYMLAGEMAGNVGIMRPGAYFWRPPGILHGPYGSATGSLGFFRTQGGPLVNEWTDYEVTFTYSPAYRPVLPKALRKTAREVRPATSCY